MVSMVRKKWTENTGLRILTQIPLDRSNVVVKSGLKSLTRTTFTLTSLSAISSHVNDMNGDDGFLGSCHLCKKPLRPDQDVYMYRGDQGFCSVECRSRQIAVDDAREMGNADVKNWLQIAKPTSSFSSSSSSSGSSSSSSSSSSFECGGCETCRLLEELRQQRHSHDSKASSCSLIKHQPLVSIFFMEILMNVLASVLLLNL